MTTAATTTIPVIPITKSADPVVAAYSNEDTTTVDRLRACQLGLARLYAQLVWLEEHPDAVEDLLETGRTVSRRVRAIKKLVEIELKDRRLRGHEPQIDLHNPLVKQVVALFVDTLFNVTRTVVSANDADEIIKVFTAKVAADPDIPWP